MSLAKGVWVYVEQREGQLEDISLQLVSGSRRFADKLGEKLSVAAVGGNDEELAATLASYGADRVCFLDSPLLLQYSPELYSEALFELFIREQPGIVLCAAGLIGMDLAPRLAARLKTGLVSDCTGLALDDERLLLQTKLTHGGKVSSAIVCPASRPQIATIRADALEKGKPDAARKPEITVINPKLSEKASRIRVKDFIKGDLESIGIDEADVIVAGGRGVGSAENFTLLKDLARSLGGVLAGSLAVVDEGWLPRERLIGQTGTTVAPRLYIACGISGASHHTLGMKDSGTIVAINTDPYAPIFKMSDVSIVGDITAVVPAITNKLKQMAKNQ
jgi:electron transfer flavoprotein alpha subunit